MSLYARLPATATAAAREDTQGAGAIVLLHHIDTVPAGDGWRHPPHGGESPRRRALGARRDRHQGARGRPPPGVPRPGARAAAAPPARCRLPRRRRRGGRRRRGHRVATRGASGALHDVAAVLNEGGVNKAVAGRALFWGIEVDQKRPLWLEVRAAGRAGHASAANPERHPSPDRRPRPPRRGATPRRVTPAAADFLPHSPASIRRRAVRSSSSRARRGGASSRRRIQRPQRLRRPLSLPGFESLLTDTVQITTLAGSARINVVAGEARAGIDVRLLPTPTSGRSSRSSSGRSGRTHGDRPGSPRPRRRPPRRRAPSIAPSPRRSLAPARRGPRAGAGSRRPGLHPGVHRLALLPRPRDRRLRPATVRSRRPAAAHRPCAGRAHSAHRAGARGRDDEPRAARPGARSAGPPRLRRHP